MPAVVTEAPNLKDDVHYYLLYYQMYKKNRHAAADARPTAVLLLMCCLSQLLRLLVQKIAAHGCMQTAILPTPYLQPQNKHPKHPVASNIHIDTKFHHNRAPACIIAAFQQHLSGSSLLPLCVHLPKAIMSFRKTYQGIMHDQPSSTCYA
jgi:hypothetical protein